MSLIVHKYGGTSVASIKMIKKIAMRIVNIYDNGDDIVVVLSAMAGVTDSLIKIASKISINPDRREVDTLISIGEQASVSIMTMILNEMGYKAKSILANQIGIITNSTYGNSSILKVDMSNIRGILLCGFIPIIAGFQACDVYGNITTLGRGGSDTSAVVIASELGADLCEIHTDVDGIYNIDPNICMNAKKLDVVSYKEIFYMASLGSKVLNRNSISFAKDYNIKIIVRSSFMMGKGTKVIKKNKKTSIGITYDSIYSTIILTKFLFDLDNIVFQIIKMLIKYNILVDMFNYRILSAKKNEFIFTILKSDLNKVLKFQKYAFKNLFVKSFIIKNDVKISIVGLNPKSYYFIISQVFNILTDKKINVMMFNVSKGGISFIVEEKYLKIVINILNLVLSC